MPNFRLLCTTLMVIMSINQSEQMPADPEAAKQSITREHPPINIIRIRPIDSESSNKTENSRRKSNIRIDRSESKDSMSSVIVIKPLLSPVAQHRPKKSPKKNWKKMMIRRPKFLHDIKKNDDTMITRVARVHLASGAYPVFYGLAKSNGSFNKIKLIRRVH